MADNAKYTVSAYFDEDKRGVADRIICEDWSEVEQKAHEFLSNGHITTIEAHDTGVELTLTPDEYFESFEGEFPLKPDDFKVPSSKVIEWLKEEVNKHCDNDGRYQIYSSGYRDVIPDNVVLEEFVRLFESGNTECSMADALIDYLWTDYGEYGMDSVAEDYLKYDIESDLKALRSKDALLDDAVEDYLESGEPFYDLMEPAGYHGATFDLEDFLGEYKINLMFGTAEEQNQDMASITGLFQDLDFNSQYAKDNYERFSDNAMTYLIYQQGHTLDEAMQAVAMDETSSDSLFMKTLVEEMRNVSYTMNTLTFLTEVGGRNMIDLLDSIIKKEGCIKISDDAMFGLYNPWNGSGCMGMETDTPIVMPASMVRDIQIEGTKVRTYEYTVNEVFGLNGTVWQPAEAVNEAPIQYTLPSFEEIKSKLAPEMTSDDKKKTEIELD